MDNSKQILVVGTGLIGGSICLCIKQRHPHLKIVGMDTNKVSLEEALEARAIDAIGDDLKKEVVKSSLIILCTPVKKTCELLVEISKLPLLENTMITDVGSTKGEVTETARVFAGTNGYFIGGHPMAGSHKSGFIAADVDLFENAYYIFTPSSRTPEILLEILEEILAGTRAKFLRLSAEKHDRITAVVSHLPHIIASSLVNHHQLFTEDYPESKQLAAGGFRDITRIASSDPIMWTDISLSNQKILIEEIDIWQSEMAAIKEKLINLDKEAVFSFFSEAKTARDTLPIRESGAIPAFNDLFVEVPDYSGEIAKVTGILAEANLSLTNLKILENREDIFGTLQLSFKHSRDVGKAKELLTNEGLYKCYEK